MTDASDPDVAELNRLERAIPVLAARVEQARQAWTAAEQTLTATRQHRDEIVWRLRTRAEAQAAAEAEAEIAAEVEAVAGCAPALIPPAGTTPVGVAAGAAAGGGAAGRTPEASTRTFQNVLFILGGLLLGTAAVVFTAVAWAAYGVGGRAAILAITTALALSAPVVALWRRLHATAETFAGVGLLLVILDGYAAWYVNLFGVNALPGTRYAGLVSAVTAAIAAGYGLLTRLVGPGFVAILVVQPAIPLFAVESHPTVTGWSIVVTALAVLNLAVVWRAMRAGGSVAVVRQAIGGTIAAGAWVIAALSALAVLVTAGTAGGAARAGGAVLLVAGTLALAAALTRVPAVHAVAAFGVVTAIVVAATRFVAVAWPASTMVLVALVVAAVTLLIRAVRPLVPAAIRLGSTIGAVVATAILAIAVTGLTLLVAADTISHAASQATPTSGHRFDWQLLAALALTTLAFLAVLYRAVLPEPWAGWVARSNLVVVAGSLAVLALPGALALPWWTPSILDTAAVALLTLLAVLAPSAQRALLPGLAAAVLTGHAVLASLARPANTATVLGALVLIGLAAAALSRRQERSAVPQAVGAGALLVALSAVAPAVSTALAAGHLQPSWVTRLTCASVLLVLAGLVAVHRSWPRLRWYAFVAALGSAAIWPTVAAFSGTDPVGIYAGIGLVLIAATLIPMRGEETLSLISAAIAATPAALLLAVQVAPPVLAVVVLPYAWFRAIWSGAPGGVGLAPATTLADIGGIIEVTAAHAVALACVALASATVVYAVRRRVRSALGGLGVGGPTAIIVALVAARAQWPVVPAVTLLLGLVIVVTVAIVQVGRWRTAVGVIQAAAYVGAGLSGALTVKWSTLLGLGSIVVGAVLVGMTGRSVDWRGFGWVVAVGAALATAAAAGLAADLPVRDAAYGVLGVAVAALALGAALRSRGTAESNAVQATAHAGAAMAMLMTAGSAGPAAAICSLWGLAVGLRALWPGTSREGRATLAAVAAGWQLVAWWLLLGAHGVVLVEAYTLPLAAVALLAGWAALRSRPELRSWIAYGPALAAAFLPTLALVVAPDSENSVPRRLLLGVGALAVVFAGSIRHRQAPVVVGGIVVGIVALHEIALVWALLPSWIPLSLGGLLLVGLAITYERRRRDVAWLRTTIGRMR
jgi:hypothetical protein